MTDTITRADPADVPVGHPVTTEPAEEDSGFVGITDHGTPNLDRITPADFATLRSAVWGNRTAPITSVNGQFATWDPCQTGGRCTGGCHDGCCWYDFSTGVCLPHCTHPGMDIGLARHTALYAAQGGVVEFAGANQFYRPYHVTVRAPNGELHIYGHMWSIDAAVVRGGRVATGQYLGTSGEQTLAGSTTAPDGSGPHLHFERRSAGGCSLDPTGLLAGATLVGHCPPTPPPAFTGAPVQVGSVAFTPDKRTVEVTFDGLGRRRWATLEACPTGDPLPLGARVKVLYWIRGAEVAGDDRWWVAEDGSRLHVAGTREKPGVA